jgi:hypothetical protein
MEAMLYMPSRLGAHPRAKTEPRSAGISNFSPMDDASDDRFEVAL